MSVQCHLDQTFPLKSVMYVDDTKQICMEQLLILFTLISWLFILNCILTGSILPRLSCPSDSDRVLYQLIVKLAIMFTKFEFGYSMKNISLPSQKEYVMQLISSVETFVKNIRWRAHCIAF